MKDKIKLVLLIILIVVGTIIIFVKPPGQSEGKKSEQGLDNVTQKNKKVVPEEKRIEKFQKFAKEGNLSNNENSNNENSSGFVGVALGNKSSLIQQKVMNLDGVLAMDSILKMPINSVLEVHKKTFGLTEQQVKDYYTKNANKMEILYGINNYNSFINFKNILDKFNRSTKLTSVEINAGTIVKQENGVSFNLTFRTEKPEVLVEYKLIIIENTEKNEALYKIIWQ